MTIAERHAAVQGDAQSATVEFWITGHNAWADAYQELYNASVGYTTGTPNFSGFNGIPAQSVKVEEVSEARGYWNGTVQYGYDTPRNTKPDSTDGDDITFSFETSVKPKLERWITDGTGWSQVGSVEPATGYKGFAHPGLGYAGPEKGYEGIQIARPETTFSLEYTPDTLTPAQLTTIRDSVGKVNSDTAPTFYGYAAGEVLLSGIRGQRKQNDRWRISYQFVAKKNRTNVDCGNGVIIGNVDGWDIIDVEYIKSTVKDPGPPATETFQLVTKQARVMRPYARLNFTTSLFPYP